MEDKPEIIFQEVDYIIDYGKCLIQDDSLKNKIKVYGHNSKGFFEELLERTDESYKILKEIFIPKNPCERFDYITDVHHRGNKIYVHGFNSECIMKIVLEEINESYRIVEDVFVPINEEEFKDHLGYINHPYIFEEEIRARERYYYANGFDLPKESELIKQEGWLLWYSAASRT